MAGARYRVLEVLRTSERASLYRAERASDGRQLLLKVLAPGRAQAAELGRLENELRVARMLDGAGALRVLGQERYDGLPALVLEDFPGRPLDDLRVGPLPPEPFLRLALAVARALGQVHEGGVLHKDLTPDHILYDQAAGEARLTDLGLARAATREQARPRAAALIEGTLAYVAPEQTGRVGRSVDQRSDLYALGAIFYELLTGRIPFAAADALEAVHAHIARPPLPPRTLVPELPEVLERITLKLLAKAPEDRYQSAAGLVADLERCLDQWQASGVLALFPLGERDRHLRLELPAQLYGREVERAALARALRQVRAGDPAPALILVRGPAGAGKTALVRSLEEPVLALRGLFAAGCFEPNDRDVPYAAFTRLFRDLCLDVLGEPDDRIAARRSRLESELGAGAALLVHLVPALKALLGAQPPPAPLPPAETQRRACQAFEHFLSVFAAPEHPLVLFLDDVQWADPASLAVLEHLAAPSAPRPILTIAAFRDGDAAPAFAVALARLRRPGLAIEELFLGALAPPAIEALLADTLRRPPDEVRPLGELVRRRTGGNPFFIAQFLGDLQRDGLLVLDRAAHGWRWDVPAIAARHFSEDVLELMGTTLRRLPPATRALVERAAVVGPEAELALLAELGGSDEAAVLAQAAPAAAAGLLVPAGESLRFLHERVREAAMQAVPEHQRAALHREIGRWLLRRHPPEALEGELYAVVAHLNLGIPAISDRSERLELAALDLRAGRRARAAGAFAAARDLFATGVSLLGGGEQRPELAFALELERAQAELACGDPGATRRRLPALLGRAPTVAERIGLHRLWQDVALAEGRILEAVEQELAGLAAAGISLPARPGWEEVRGERARIEQLLHAHPLEALPAQRPMADPELRAALEMRNPSYFVDPKLSFLHAARMLALTLERGLGDSSAFWCANYGFGLSGLFGDPRAGRPFVLAARTLQERQPGDSRREEVEFCAGTVTFWTDPLSEVLPAFRLGFAKGVEHGNPVPAWYCATHLLQGMLIRGDTLERTEEEIAGVAAFARGQQLRNGVELMHVFGQFVRCLQGRTAALGLLDSDGFSEAAFEEAIAQEPMSTEVCIYFAYKLRARYLAGRLGDAAIAAERATALAWSAAGLPVARELVLYRALTLAALLGAGPDTRAEGWRAALQADRVQLRAWAELNPATFRAGAALVEAEVARTEGRREDAVRFYQESVAAAAAGGLLIEEALAHELGGRYFLAQGLRASANLYLHQARLQYLRWGAEAKARQLEELEPRLRTRGRSAGRRAGDLDVLAALKASQAISGEVVLEKLVARLLEILLAESGAERGCLLLRRDGKLVVQAEACLGPTGTEVRPAGEAPEASPVPRAITQYSARTGETFVVADAALDPRFAEDEYVRARRPRSVLCLPLRHKGEVMGLLYLENRVLSGVFTPERQAMTELLAGQAAISLENARLYRQAQEATRLRDEFLQVASHELNTPVSALVLSLQGLLELDPDDPSARETQRRLVVLAERQGQRLGRLVRELLDVSRMEREQFKVQPEPVDLAALVREVLGRLQPELARAGCTVRLEAAHPVPGRWDALRLEQVVFNLLSNAWKFGAGQPVEVRVESDGQRARLTVRDHGPGIPPERQAAIFDRFARAVSADHYGGLGLGLSISRRIVEAHGGTIQVVSQPGQGATFVVELPCAGPPAEGDRERQTA